MTFKESSEESIGRFGWRKKRDHKYKKNIKKLRNDKVLLCFLIVLLNNAMFVFIGIQKRRK